MTLRYVAIRYRVPEADLTKSLGLPFDTDADTTLKSLADHSGISPFPTPATGHRVDHPTRIALDQLGTRWLKGNCAPGEHQPSYVGQIVGSICNERERAADTTEARLDDDDLPDYEGPEKRRTGMIKFSSLRTCFAARPDPV